MTKPDPAQRPNVVVWAYRCWLVAGGLLAALGAAYILMGIFVFVETLVPVGAGVLVAAVGVAYILLGSKTYTGDERWRSSLAALTLVVVIMLLVLSFLSFWLAIALLPAILGLLGSLLAYRPAGDAWFTGKQPVTTAPAKKGAHLKKRGKKTR
ncbi:MULTISPECIES: hypothetical protein [unclassified Gordonia (in: high G+C Gram-positive bacteria)]